MPAPAPNFSRFPWERLPRLGRGEAARATLLARWAAARPVGGRRVIGLAGGPVRVLGIDAAPAGGAPAGLDPDAALAEVRLGGAALVVAGPAALARALAQRLLGGPAELPAPRPLTAAEHAVWALGVAAALEDAGIAGEVWPLAERVPAAAAIATLRLDVAGRPASVAIAYPPELAVRPPPPLPPGGPALDVPIVIAACAVPAAAARALAVGDVVTVAPAAPGGGARAALWVGEAALGLVAAHGAVEATVATGYNARDMALPDDAHLELTVQLGTTRLSLRQLAELTPGAIVPLGRPLAGPFEVRAAGTVIGAGELVDIDGELGVRMVSLQDAGPTPPRVVPDR